MIGFDTGLRVIIWNDATAQWSGLSYGQVAGRLLWDIFPAAKAVPGLPEALRQALQGWKSFLPATGDFYLAGQFEVHTVPLHDDSGAVSGVLQVLHDVAHLQKADRELKRFNDMLARKNRELEGKNAELIAFARITSHDLKEPLHKIHLFSNMFLDQEQGRLSGEAAALFARIQRSAKRAEALTDDIFTFSDIQNVSEPLGEVDLALTLKVAKRHLQLPRHDTNAVIAGDRLPAVTGYRTLIQRLFENILDNALKFQPAGSQPHIAIRCGAATGAAAAHPDALADAVYAWVSFTDNGIGFEQQYEGLVFELFRRLPQPAGAYAGNGIGLSLCRKIMDLHRSFITAKSAPGEGSTFTCYFPARGG